MKICLGNKAEDILDNIDETIITCVNSTQKQYSLLFLKALRYLVLKFYFLKMYFHKLEKNMQQDVFYFPAHGNQERQRRKTLLYPCNHSIPPRKANPSLFYAIQHACARP